MGESPQTSYMTPPVVCTNGISGDTLPEADYCAGVSPQNLLVFPNK